MVVFPATWVNPGRVAFPASTPAPENSTDMGSYTKVIFLLLGFLAVSVKSRRELRWAKPEGSAVVRLKREIRTEETEKVGCLGW